MNEMSGKQSKRIRRLERDMNATMSAMEQLAQRETQTAINVANLRAATVDKQDMANMMSTVHDAKKDNLSVAVSYLSIACLIVMLVGLLVAVGKLIFGV